MTLKPYLWGIRISTAISFAAWVLVIRQVDPEKTGIIGQVLFFGSTFLLLAGVFILFFSWLRRHVGGNEETALIYIGVSFRQGVLMSVLAIILLFLQQNRVLTWWDGALTVAGIFLVELYFLTRR
jgi:ABC-type Fe3+-siderophore transport system permease subunit